MMDKYHRMRIGKRKALQRRINTYTNLYGSCHHINEIKWCESEPWKCYNDMGLGKLVRRGTNHVLRRKEREYLSRILRDYDIEIEEQFIPSGNKYRRTHDIDIYY